uniref:Putative secreted protein n=1 Tax=Anopheles triannulatus TaxID=58253 RepID=A0A2M4B1W7_9DIPT
MVAIAAAVAPVAGRTAAAAAGSDRGHTCRPLLPSSDRPPSRSRHRSTPTRAAWCGRRRWCSACRSTRPPRPARG